MSLFDDSFSYTWELLWIIVGLLIAYSITALFGRPFKIYYRNITFKLFSKEFKYNLFFKYYFILKTNELDSNVFNNIKEKFPELEIGINKISPESITINPEKLGGKVNIFLDSVDELQKFEDEDLRQSNEYVLTIKLDSFIWIGYKRLEILNQYIVLFKEIQEIVKNYCFNGGNAFKSFVICDIVRDVDKITNLNKKSITSKKMEISFIGNDIKFVSEEPVYLVETIKKYIGY